MPIDVIDADEFTSPITAPAGGDPRVAATFAAPIQKLANRTRYLKERLDPVASMVNPILGRGAYFPALRFVPEWDPGESRPAWQPADLGAGVLRCWSGDGSAFLTLMGGSDLPTDCTITTIRVWVKPASTGLIEANRVSATYALIGNDFETGTYAIEKRVADTDAIQAIEWTGVSHQIFYATSHPGSPHLGIVIRVNGSHGTAPRSDRLLVAELHYTVGAF